MVLKKKILLGSALLLVLTGAQAWAHTPLCSCYDNGDNTISCEGGFSDGSSASGVKMRVEDAKGGIIEEGQMSASSEFVFDKPDVEYKVIFDGGEGHTIEIDGKDIIE